MGHVSMSPGLQLKYQSSKICSNFLRAVPVYGMAQYGIDVTGKHPPSGIIARCSSKRNSSKRPFSRSMCAMTCRNIHPRRRRILSTSMPGGADGGGGHRGRNAQKVLRPLRVGFRRLGES